MGLINPFGNMSLLYSTWLVILMVYNLPPFLCMKSSYLLLMLLIPGPIALGKDIDVFLRPLVDELKELWEEGLVLRDVVDGSLLRCIMHCYGQLMIFLHVIVYMDGVDKYIRHVQHAMTRHHHCDVEIRLFFMIIVDTPWMGIQ